MPADQNLIASSFEDPAKSLWGRLKQVHTIKSFKDDDKFGFKQIYTFEDHLTQSLKPVLFLCKLCTMKISTASS